MMQRYDPYEACVTHVHIMDRFNDLKFAQVPASEHQVNVLKGSVQSKEIEIEALKEKVAEARPVRMCDWCSLILLQLAAKDREVRRLKTEVR